MTLTEKEKEALRDRDREYLTEKSKNNHVIKIGLIRNDNDPPILFSCELSNYEKNLFERSNEDQRQIILSEILRQKMENLRL